MWVSSLSSPCLYSCAAVLLEVHLLLFQDWNDAITIVCMLSWSNSLWPPSHYSPPGSSVQAGILEWVAFPTARDLPDPWTEPMSLASPALAGRFSTTAPKYSEAMWNKGQELRTWKYPSWIPSLILHMWLGDFDPGGSEVKASAWNAGDPGSIPGSGRSPGEGNGNPLQYSCLEDPMEEGTW